MKSTYQLNKEDAVLLVIDLQERLMPAMYDRDFLLKKASVLLNVAKVFNLPVVMTEQYPKGLGHTVDSLLSLIESEELPVEVFHKTSFTAFTPEVKECVERHNRKQVIVIGAETHVCVFQTVRDLLAEGYMVFVPFDAVDSRTQENKNNALDLFSEMGAVVTNTETILFDLLQVSGTPEFKKLSALIK